MTFQKGVRFLAIRICLYALALMILASAAIALWMRQRQATEVLGSAVSIPQTSVYPFGVNVSLEQYDAAGRERALAMIEAAGLRWVRQTFPWAGIEPRRGDYRWQPWDEVVSAVQAHDLSLIAVLDTSPSWARRDPNGENPYTPPQEIADYGRFVQAFAGRYGGQIDYYQIWDEPNISAHWGDGYVDAAAYTALLREGYAQIQIADPVAYVLTAGLAPTTEEGPLNLNEVAFLRGLYAAGGRDDFDVLAAKPYGFWSGPADRREDVAVLNFSRLALLRQVMADEGDEEKAVWAVEFGWNSLPPDWSGRPSPWGTDSEELQAQRTVEAIQRAQDEWPWLGVMLLPEFQPNVGDDDPRWGFALVDHDGKPRLLYRRIQEVATAPPVAYAGYYPADHYTAWYQGDWRWSPLGADIGQDGDSLTIPFKGTRLDLTVRRGDFLGYLYVTVDGQPANGLPQDGQGRSYLILYDPLYRTETVTLAAGLPDTTHEAVIVAHGGWGQWAIVGWTVAREIDARPYRVALSLIGLGALLVLWRLLALINKQRSEVYSLLVICCSRLGDYAAHYRSLSEGLQLALTAIVAAVFYFSPWQPLGLLSLLFLAVLIWLRLDLGLALAAFCVPFFLQPKHILAWSFSMVEITTLLCLAAWALRWSVATVRNGWLKKGAEGKIPRSPFQYPISNIQHPASSLDGAVLFFVAVSAFSLLFAENFGVAMREFRVMVLESALFYFLLRVSSPSKKQLWRVVDALVLAATLVALIGLYQYSFTADIVTAEGVRRIRGLYGSPNNLSLFLDRIVPVLAVVALFARQSWRRMAYALCSLPVLFCLYLTYSRGAWLLGLPAAALFIGLLRGRKALWISLAAICIIALSLLPLIGTERFASLLDTQDGTTFFRLKLWQSSLNMIKDHPFFGVGLDNFLYQYRTRYVLPEAWQELDLSHPHNIVLDYWTRLGILGVVALVWLEGAFFVRGLRLYRRLPDRDERALALGLMASMVAGLAHGLIDNSYFLVDLAFVFFITVGIMAGMSAQIEGAQTKARSEAGWGSMKNDSY